MVSKSTRNDAQRDQMDLKMDYGSWGTLKMAIRGLQETKHVRKKILEAPKGRPREPKRDENGTDAPLFGVSGGFKMDRN